MRKRFFVLISFLLFLNFFSGFNFVSALENSNEKIEINFFWMQGCSACGQMEPFLEDLEKEYDFKLNSYETSKHRDLFLQMLNEYNVPDDRKGYVPIVFVQDNYFVGYSDQIMEMIESILKGHEINNSEILIGEIVKTKVLGVWNLEFSLKGKSVFGAGFILALLDSINVCSITVLVFLIVFSLSVCSLKRAFKIGFFFIFIIFIFYTSFMLLLTGILGYFVAQYGIYIRLAVILISVFAGLLLIKDFFWYGKGPSLRIPQSAKPILEKYMKQATLSSTIILGVLASLVELPCTAIFPLIYTAILAEAGVSGLQRVSYILFYNLIYIWPLIFIVFGTYLSWTRIESIDRILQKYKKIMKLIAGISLLLISFYFAGQLIF